MISIVTYKTNLQELALCLNSLTSSLISIIYVIDNLNPKYIADFCTQYSNIIYISSNNIDS